MLSTIGRAAVKRIGGGIPTSTNRALQTLWQIQRAEHPQSRDSSIAQARSWLNLTRSYATATKTAARPKTAAARKTTTAKAGRTTGTSKAKPKAKPKKAAKKKAVKKKPAAKKPKAKKPKTPLTEEQKSKAQLKRLKLKALLSEEPKSLPNSAWQVLLEREAKNSKAGAAAISAQASTKYKSLAPAEIEDLNHEANTNKTKSAVTYKQWVESHSPSEIKEANNARNLLRRLTKTSRGYRAIPDERIPKRAVSALLLFTKDRHASGDLKGVGDFKAVSKLVISEWNSLSDVERRKYDDLAAADRERYSQEVKTVFKRDISPPSS